MAEQFVKIENGLVRDCAGTGNLSKLGAYAVTAYYLQMPSAPKGGLRNALYGASADGVYTVGKRLAELREDGLMLRVRHYDGTQFCDRYLLRPTNDGTGEVGDKNRVIQPKTDYLCAPAAVLRDNRLSFAAKGLYLAMVRLQEMRKIGVPIHLTKVRIRQGVHMHEQAFDRLWSMLKAAGYLTLTRRWNAEFHVTDCEITLNGTIAAPNAAENGVFVAQNRRADLTDGVAEGQAATHSDAAAAEVRKAVEWREPSNGGSVQGVVRLAEPDWAKMVAVSEATNAERKLMGVLLRELYGTAPGETVATDRGDLSAEAIREAVAGFTPADCAEILSRVHAAGQKAKIRHPRGYLRACICRYFAEKNAETVDSGSDARPSQPIGGLATAPSYDLSEVERMIFALPKGL